MRSGRSRQGGPRPAAPSSSPSLGAAGALEAPRGNAHGWEHGTACRLGRPSPFPWGSRKPTQGRAQAGAPVEQVRCGQRSPVAMVSD